MRKKPVTTMLTGIVISITVLASLMVAAGMASAQTDYRDPRLGWGSGTPNCDNEQVSPANHSRATATTWQGLQVGTHAGEIRHNIFGPATVPAGKAGWVRWDIPANPVPQAASNVLTTAVILRDDRSSPSPSLRVTLWDENEQPIVAESDGSYALQHGSTVWFELGYLPLYVTWDTCFELEVVTKLSPKIDVSEVDDWTPTWQVSGGINELTCIRDEACTGEMTWSTTIRLSLAPGDYDRLDIAVPDIANDLPDGFVFDGDCGSYVAFDPLSGTSQSTYTVAGAMQLEMTGAVNSRSTSPALMSPINGSLTYNTTEYLGPDGLVPTFGYEHRTLPSDYELEAPCLQTRNVDELRFSVGHHMRETWYGFWIGGYNLRLSYTLRVTAEPETEPNWVNEPACLDELSWNLLPGNENFGGPGFIPNPGFVPDGGGICGTLPGGGDPFLPVGPVPELELPGVPNPGLPGGPFINPGPSL